MQHMKFQNFFQIKNTSYELFPLVSTTDCPCQSGCSFISAHLTIFSDRESTSITFWMEHLVYLIHTKLTATVSSTVNDEIDY